MLIHGKQLFSEKNRVRQFKTLLMFFYVKYFLKILKCYCRAHKNDTDFRNR